MSLNSRQRITLACGGMAIIVATIFAPRIVIVGGAYLSPDIQNGRLARVIDVRTTLVWLISIVMVTVLGVIALGKGTR